MLVEQQRAHCKSVLMVDGEVFVLFGAAVEFGVPEFDVGLVGGEAHGVAAGFAGRVVPEFRVCEAVV